MPAWLLKVVIEAIGKLVTPEVIAKIEKAAKEFVVCQLKTFAASTESEIDDVLVAKVAEALGVDCAAV